MVLHCNSRRGDVALFGGIAFELTLASYIGVDLGHEAHFICVACQPPPYVADQSEASVAVSKINLFTLHALLTDYIKIILSKNNKRRSFQVILTLLTD